MKKKYVIRCSRCGYPIEYSSEAGYYYAKNKQKTSVVLCKKCKKEKTRLVELGLDIGEAQLMYKTKNEAVLICKECGGMTELHGNAHIHHYIDRYGNGCSGYVCRKCKTKISPDPGFKTCSVCGKQEALKNRDAKRYYEETFNDLHPYVCKECKNKKKNESKIITCRVCGKKKELTTKNSLYYWKYKEAEGKSYLCPECRKIKAEYSVDNGKNAKNYVYTKEYKDLQKKLMSFHSFYVNSGMSESAMDVFLTSVAEYLESLYISDFDLNIVDGKIIGIYLHRVSVYKEMYVPFENTLKAFGKRGVPN